MYHHTPNPTPTQPSAVELELAREALDRLSPNAGRVLLTMRGYEQGERGECRAKASTIASKLDISESAVRRALRALREWGLWVKIEKRMRFTARGLTGLGRLCASIMLGARYAPQSVEVVGHATGPATGQATGRNREAGKADNQENKTPLAIKAIGRPRAKGIESAQEYKASMRGGSLDPRAWRECASWMDATGGATSFARCKMTHKHFSMLSGVLHHSKDFGTYRRVMMTRTGKAVSSSYVLALAFREAKKTGADFGTVEQATRYITAIVASCVKEMRLPGLVIKAGA